MVWPANYYSLRWPFIRTAEKCEAVCLSINAFQQLGLKAVLQRARHECTGHCLAAMMTGDEGLRSFHVEDHFGKLPICWQSLFWANSENGWLRTDHRWRRHTTMRKVLEDCFVSGTLIEGSEPCVLLLLHGKMLFWPASAKGNPLGGLYIQLRQSSNIAWSLTAENM